jgi:hypothetical protein
MGLLISTLSGGKQMAMPFSLAAGRQYLEHEIETELGTWN